MIDHLDRIDNLGFNVNLNWNKSIEIVYDIEDGSPLPNVFDIRVFSCFYKPELGPSFEDIIETSCDFFYSWYNKNIELLKDYEYDDSDIEKYDKLVDSCLGDITNKVYRDFNLNDILDDFD
jgi:hypothetical protein